MPFVIICGYPCSGKTTVSKQLVDYFESKSLKPILISDDELLQFHGRDKLYSESFREKEVRGSLKSNVVRNISSNTLVILDAPNYIKGFRYELYCVSKEHKSTHCIVETTVEREELLRRSTIDGKYTEKTMQALIDRFEPPDSRNRWDQPHFLVHNSQIPFDEINDSLYKRVAPLPNFSTQTQPLAGTNYLHKLDSTTKETINYIGRVQQEGNVGEIVIPGSKEKLTINRALTTAQLNKLRRQYITYTKMHPVSNESQIVTMFIQYLNSNNAD